MRHVLSLDNLCFGDLKSVQLVLNFDPGVAREKKCRDYVGKWKRNLQKLPSGAVYDTNMLLTEKQICRENRKPNPIKRLLRRGIRLVKRMLAR